MMADTAEYGGAHPGGAPSGEGGSPIKDIGPAREEGGQGSGAGSSVSAGSILDCFSYLNQSQADAAPFVPLLAWLSGFDSPSPQSAGVPEECRAGGEEDTDRSRSVPEESGASAEYLVGLDRGVGMTSCRQCPLSRSPAIHGRYRRVGAFPLPWRGPARSSRSFL